MLSSLLDHTAAARLLKNGCHRLGLPDSAAIELIRFLFIKRVHDSSANDKQPRNMSPGTSLDRLWHWMLFNTKVSTAVHELVGGTVEHTGDDEEDLSETHKMMQRLYSMNLLSYEGWEPDMQLWEEPGTLMSSIYVRQPPHNSKAPELYVTAATTEQQYHELLEDMRILYQGHSRKNGWQGPPATSWRSTAPATPESAAVASGVSTATEAGDPLASPPEQPSSWSVSVFADAQGDNPKRWFDVSATDSMTVRTLKRHLLQQGLGGEGGAAPCSAALPLTRVRVFNRTTELQDHMLLPAVEATVLRVVLPGQQAPPDLPTYSLQVKTLHDTQFELTECGAWSLVGEVKAAAAEQMGTVPRSLRLIFAGKQLEDQRTLEEYNVQKNSTFNCVQRLLGC